MLRKHVSALIVALFFCGNHLYGQETAEALIKKGDQYHGAGKLQASLETFLKANEISPENSEIIWRVARAYSNLGDEEKSQDNKEKARGLYQKAEKYARNGVKINPNHSFCHTYIGVAVGNIALTESSKKKVQLSVVVKNEVMKAIELDDKNDTAHHLLARWHRGVANLSWIERGFAKIFYGGLPSASHEEAIEHFKEAVKILPTYINHRLELARTYQEIKKWELAMDELNIIEKLEAKSDKDHRYKNEANQLRIIVEKKLK
ncbi:hypothetical protein CMK17_07090 [Candidatus Poribacteria bacterium]|jgi:tetratricopeptide (TPR) repeat protein|nr:hypothetical protein [Candidatus Poribacteria bacterium]